MRLHAHAPRLSLALTALIALPVSLLLPVRASASLAREPIRRVIQASFPEIRSCMANHRYAEGTYRMQFEIRSDGLVENAALISSPGAPSEAASDCLVRVFSRLRFTPLGSSARRPPRAPLVHGRRSRVPPGPRARHASRVGITYPLRLAGSTGPSPPAPRAPDAGAPAE